MTRRLAWLGLWVALACGENHTAGDAGMVDGGELGDQSLPDPPDAGPVDVGPLADGFEGPDGGIPTSDIGEYSEVSRQGLDFVADDLSGITFVPETGTFYLIENSGGTVWEVDRAFTRLRTLRTGGGFGDSEDIVHLGGEEFAIVSEEGVLYLGRIPVGVGDALLDPAAFQAVRFAPDDAGNSGPEGVAYDAIGRVFYVAKEKEPRRLYRFDRPGPGVSMVTPTEPFDAEAVPAPTLMSDMAAVLFRPESGRLLILSDDDARAVDIALDGTVHGTLAVPLPQPEGFTFDDAGNLHVVSEPNIHAVYAR